MYADHRPPNAPPSCPLNVLVLEDTDFPCNVDNVIIEAKTIGSYADGHEVTYWIVFMENPMRAWDFTESSLRSTLNKKNREVQAKD